MFQIGSGDHRRFYRAAVGLELRTVSAVHAIIHCEGIRYNNYSNQVPYISHNIIPVGP